MYITWTLGYFILILLWGIIGYAKHKDFDRFMFYLVFAIIVRMVFYSY